MKICDLDPHFIRPGLQIKHMISHDYVGTIRRIENNYYLSITWLPEFAWPCSIHSKHCKNEVITDDHGNPIYVPVKNFIIQFNYWVDGYPSSEIHFRLATETITRELVQELLLSARNQPDFQHLECALMSLGFSPDHAQKICNNTESLSCLAQP